MRTIQAGVFLLILIHCVASTTAQDRDQLLNEPRFVEDAKIPSYVDFTAEQVAGAVTMVSGRNFAWFGFNTPEVRVILPAADNSVYAEVSFSEPTLLDANGGPVAFELERGLYDHATHHDEIRLTPAEGDQPIEFASAVGKVKIRYPLRIHTLTARRDQPPPDGLTVRFDGPFVEHVTEGEQEDLEAASFTGIEPFRVYDSAGHQLEAYPSSEVKMAGGTITDRRAYWGEAMEVQMDVVDEWVTLDVAYELPPVDPLPESQAGTAPPVGQENPATPGAKVEVAIAVETPATILAAELGVTAAEAREQLRALGYPDPKDEYFVMSAVQGKTDAAKLFLASGIPIDTVSRGSTALLSAIQYHHVDLALFLVAAGADVNIADTNNATPLFHAAGICDATELVRALIAAGADPAPATRGNTTAFQMAGIMGCTANQDLIAAAGGN